jgi:hypothetical protein
MSSMHNETNKEVEIVEFREWHKVRAIPEHKGYNKKPEGVQNINMEKMTPNQEHMWQVMSLRKNGLLNKYNQQRWQWAHKLAWGIKI